jgi:hypothetical protein
MTTVAILPISDVNGEKSYRAIAGDKHSVGETAGQALDALTANLMRLNLAHYWSSKVFVQTHFSLMSSRNGYRY